ncbi:MAG: cohesin domain-containing protein [Bacteroidaceae bacterium]|nr:cohesin domain-containing protein [Bacteroidaceae bacterium]
MKSIHKVLFLLFGIMLFSTINAKADNTLTIGNIEAKAGETITLPVNMTNSEDIIAFQFSIALPDGVTIKKEMNEDDELEYCVSLTGRAKSKHNISCGDPVNGVYTIASFSSTNQIYRENDGAICEIKLAVSSDIKGGKYEIKLQNIEMTNADNEPINPADFKATFTVPSDVTEIGKANIASNIVVGAPYSELGKDIPAAGGKDRAASKVTYSVFTRTFLSDGTYTDGAATNADAVIYGEYTSELASLGAAEKERTKVATSTPSGKLSDANGTTLKSEGTDFSKLTDCNVTATEGLDIYQEANEKSAGEVSLTVSKEVVNLKSQGETFNLDGLATAKQSISYTSGATEEAKVVLGYSVKTAKDGFSLDGNNVTVTKNETDDARNGFVITVTATGEGGKVATKDVTFNQVLTELGKANIATEIVIGEAYAESGKDIPAAGGKDRAVAKVTYKYVTRTFMENGTYTDSEPSAQLEDLIYGDYTAEQPNLGTEVKERTLVASSAPKGMLKDKDGVELKADATDFSALVNYEATADKALDIYQEANEKNAGEVSLTVNKQAVNLKSEGETFDLDGFATAKQSINYTSGATEDAKVSIAYSVKTEQDGFSLDGNNVIVTKNETADSRNGFVITVTATGEDGKVATKDITFNQGLTEIGTANIAIDVVVAEAYTESGKDIPAAGGKDRAVAKVTYKYITRTFMDNGTYTDSEPSAQLDALIYGDYTAQQPSLGTEEKERTLVASSTPKGTLKDKDGVELKKETTDFNALVNYEATADKALDIYQEANAIKDYSEVTLYLSEAFVNLDPIGETKDLARYVNANQTLTYTSGATKAGQIGITYKVKTAMDGFTLSGSNVTATKNETAIERSGFVVTVTATGEGGKSASSDITFSQSDTKLGEALIAFDINVSAPYSELGKDIPASGGKDRAIAKVTYKYTKRTFKTDGSYTDGDVYSNEVLIYGDYTENIPSLGTEVTERKKVAISMPYSNLADGSGTLLRKETTNFKELSEVFVVADKLEIYQEANIVTGYSDVDLKVKSETIEVGCDGETISLADAATASQKLTFTSGSTKENEVEVSYSVKTQKDGFKLEGNMVIVDANEANVAREGFVVTATAAGEGNKTATKDITFNQALNTAIAAVMQNANEKVYDLNGRRIQATKSQKGIFIKNNRKYIIK